jgi:signal transduction histidine kinase
MIRRENLATMGRMVANIAHEIRNPLSIIRTSADRLRRVHNIEDETIDYITEEVDELNRVLTGYLDFAQSSTRLEHTPQSCRRIIASSMLAASTEAEAKGVVIIDSLPADDLAISGDEKRLRQALLNVLLNAIQATDAGGSVTLTLSATAGKADFVVADTGAGIDRKDLAEVTRPFFTRRADGSGLGLHIVQSVVNDHGGTLNIESTPGKGTRVTMSFPLSRETT